jgi:DNA-binding IclR family transcriptional regulator
LPNEEKNLTRRAAPPAGAERSAPLRRGGETRDKALVESLARGLSILECFVLNGPILGSADIARLTGLPQPTVWRLAHTLCALGCLAPAPNDKLRLGVAALGLGYAAVSTLELSELATPLLQELSDAFACSALLGRRQDASIVYVQIAHRGPLVFSEFRAGGRFSIFDSPSGLACLAALDPRERAAVLKTKAAAGRPVKATDALIAAAVEDYRAQGWVQNAGLVHPELTTLSTPIRRRDGAPIYFLTCGGHTASIGPNARRLGRRLLEVAHIFELGLPSH